jgi:hypothetical protein
MLVLDYFVAIWKNWLSLISGIGGLILTILATVVFSDSTAIKTSLYVIAFLCLAVSSYQVWAVEYKKNIAKVKIVFENRDPYVQYAGEGSRKAKNFSVGVENIGTETIGIEVLAEIASNVLEPIHLPVTGGPHTTCLLNSKDKSKMFQLVRFTFDYPERIVYPNSDAHGRIVRPLQKDERLNITVRVLGNHINESKDFVAYIGNGELQVEEAALT